MADKIIFLGTAGDTETVGKQMLGSGGIILQTGNNQFLIDPGPGCLVRAKMYGISLRENTAILVSSNSLFCANDINVAIDATTVGGLDKKAVVVCNETLMNSPDSYLNNNQKGNVERILVLNPGQKIGINDTEIQVINAQNKDENAIGFKFVTQEATITYTGDTEFSKEVVESYSNSDILVMNVQQPFEEKEDNNLSAEDAVNILNRVKPKMAVLNHLGVRFLREDPMVIGREIQKQSGCQVTIAKDGSAIDTIGISRTKKQETLSSYQPDEQETEETTNS